MISRNSFITDNGFFETVTCPQKLSFDLESGKNVKNKTSFQQMNKLQLRDVAVQNFENPRFTSNDSMKAHEETKKWLRNDYVSICGAVLISEIFLSRYPILVKEKNKITVVQLHGKLKKSSSKNISVSESLNNSTLSYLLKAAYRSEVLNTLFPESRIEVELMFPMKIFRSKSENLFHELLIEKSRTKELMSEFNRLYSALEGTEAVNDIRRHLPEQFIHERFFGKSVRYVMDMIEEYRRKLNRPFVREPHDACKQCHYRKAAPALEEGCWERHFIEKNANHVNSHKIDLIGNTEYLGENLLQENCHLLPAYDDAEKIIGRTSPVITIRDRQALQILGKKGRSVPKVWCKPGIQKLQSLKYPLHFIDFEAATYPLPMWKDAGPYSQVYFQFSCHTLFEDGQLKHTEWLDIDISAKNPNRLFIKQLAKIDKIFEGTIVHYSPFEKQGLNRLVKWEMKKGMSSNHITLLRNIIAGNDPEYDSRFMDLNRMVESFYHNQYLENSLGLKEVLISALEVERVNNRNHKLIDLCGQKINLFKVNSDGSLNPYQKLHSTKIQIEDGSEAMNAYLYLKSGNLIDAQKKTVINAMKRYCALDSYALVFILEHLKTMSMKMTSAGDYVIR